jgi:hypothetical protein
MDQRPTPAARDSWQDAVEEADELRSADAAQHYRLLAEACELVFAILAARADRQEALDYQEPIPPESAALIEQLIQRGQ